MFCKVLIGVSTSTSVGMFVIYSIAVYRLLYYARRHQHYLFKKYRVIFAIQSICILVGMLVAVLYDSLHILAKNNHKHEFLTAILVYFATMLPPFAISLLMKPKDLFTVFNMYPEQL